MSMTRRLRLMTAPARSREAAAKAAAMNRDIARAAREFGPGKVRAAVASGWAPTQAATQAEPPPLRARVLAAFLANQPPPRE